MDRLRFSTAILRLLGEELNPSPDQGVLELIKNAYDADAQKCVVELKGVHLKGGSLRIWDDGRGMTAEEIRNGWLIVGDSLKNRSSKSPSGRLLVGSKGLGRLGALRLGRSVTLIARPIKEEKVQYRVKIDWDEFDKVKVVEDVEIDIASEPRSMGATHGTEIRISNLPTVWRKSDIHRLARAILLLRDPFSEDRSFQASLKADEFVDITRLAHSGYFSEVDFHLTARVDEEGKASAEVKTSSGATIFRAKHNEISGEKVHPIYSTPAASFELWEFSLSGKNFSTKQTTLKAVRQWLEEFGGIRLYHRGIRILPYGEPKNDWLDMNLRRSQSPEYRPSTNNSLGLIRVDDPRGILQQKTDRLGFVDSESFDELLRFAGDALDWMARERLRERDRRRKTQIEQTIQKKQEAESSISSVLQTLSVKQRAPVEAVIEQLRHVHQAEVELKDESAQLYFTLGTIGTTAAAFAHQTKVPITGILADAKMLDDYLGDPNTLALYREASSKAVKRIKSEASAIYSYSTVTLKLLEHEKRRSATFAVHNLIDDTIALLQPYFEARETQVECDYAPENPQIWCARAAIEAVLTNLLTNSLQAFEDRHKKGSSQERRLIHIRTRVAGALVTICVQDSGPGIDKLSINEIWIAGKTTTERGTGLGLAIVKDVVEDLRGSITAEAHGELGGAMFTISLPLKK